MVRIHGHESRTKSILLLIILFSMAGFHTSSAEAIQNLHLHRNLPPHPGRLRLLSQLLVGCQRNSASASASRPGAPSGAKPGAATAGKPGSTTGGRPGTSAATRPGTAGVAKPGASAGG